jgi:heme-degrading monooxygenase HmoA
LTLNYIFILLYTTKFDQFQPFKMAITELAIIPLTHPLTKDNSTLPTTLISKLQRVKQVLTAAAGYPFHFFQQVEDPSVIYIIGAWDTADTHSTFLPSPENKNLLQLLDTDIVTNDPDPSKNMQMFHLSTDILGPHAKDTTAVLAAPVISCNRHFVPLSKKDDFTSKFKEVKGLLEDYTKPYQVVGGWRMEKEKEEKEEWVLFSGFESVDHHMEFAKTEEFAKYREIVGCVEGFEVRHLKKIEW